MCEGCNCKGGSPVDQEMFSSIESVEISQASIGREIEYLGFTEGETRGILLGFGINSNTMDGVTHTYSSAIIETKDGEIINPSVEDVRFIKEEKEK